jgi:hypothetical protein
MPPDNAEPHPLLQDCISKAQTLVDSVSVEEVISALFLLDSLARRPGRPRESVSCNRRIMARLVELCCVAPRKDILIYSLSVKFPSSSDFVFFENRSCLCGAGSRSLQFDQVLC